MNERQVESNSPLVKAIAHHRRGLSKPIAMSGQINIDVRDFYQTVRQCLEACPDIESDLIDGLCRAVAGLKRLIGSGQATVTIPVGSWIVIADAIEGEADRIDNIRRVPYRRCRPGVPAFSLYSG